MLALLQTLAQLQVVLRKVALRPLALLLQVDVPGQVVAVLLQVVLLRKVVMLPALLRKLVAVLQKFVVLRTLALVLQVVAKSCAVKVGKAVTMWRKVVLLQVALW